MSNIGIVILATNAYFALGIRFIKKFTHHYKGNKQSMKDENIRKMWQEFINDIKYKEYFLSNEEIWKDNLNKVKEYIHKYKKRPSNSTWHLNWLLNQRFNYEKNMYIMKEENIREEWKCFTEEYGKYFDNEKQFLDKCIYLENWIKNNNRFPTHGNNKNREEYLIAKWCCWLREQYKLNKEKFTTFNYIETNEVIIDYRKNELGYYWVDLNCYYSAEMLFRLNNCGRVNSYQNFLELREYDDTNFNNSKVAIVISSDGFINQIRGDYNMKPDMIYRNFIYDLFLNYKKLKGFNFLFGKEIDFTHLDLTKEQLCNLKRIRPELFSLI
jgi:hypothetical protein